MRQLRNDSPRELAAYYLVQRLIRSSTSKDELIEKYGSFEAAPPLQQVAATQGNPFGYGRLGDYELDYMGSAEFEWGALGESWSGMADKELEGEFGYQFDESHGILAARKLDFVYLKDDGSPLESFSQWANGSSGREPFWGKERPYDFMKGLMDPKDARVIGHVWWALGARLFWAFHEEDGTEEGCGHLAKFITGLDPAKNPPMTLRGGQPQQDKRCGEGERTFPQEEHPLQEEEA